MPRHVKDTATCCNKVVYRSADDNNEIPRCQESGLPAEDCKDACLQEDYDSETTYYTEDEDTEDEDDKETVPDCAGNAGTNTASSTPSFTSNNTGTNQASTITEDRPAEDSTPDLGVHTQPQHTVTPGPFPQIQHDIPTFPHSPIRNEPEHGPEFPETVQSDAQSRNQSLPIGELDDLTPAVRRLNFGSPTVEEQLLGITRRLATLEAENNALRKKVRRLESPEFTGDGSEENPIMFLE